MKRYLCILLGISLIFGGISTMSLEAEEKTEIPEIAVSEKPEIIEPVIPEITVPEEPGDFEPEEPDISVTEAFSDVYNDWYTEYVQYVYDTGLMSGMQGTTKFAPNANISKAQVAQVLYNLEGKPEVVENPVFAELKDVYETEWYAAAVSWAYNEGIVTGDINTKKFSPNADVTREQLGIMIYRFAKYKKYDITDSSDLEGMKNAENTANWALEGVKWAVGAGLISGVEKDGVKDLEPQKNASRAQVAAILKRFDGQYLRNSDAVEVDGHYYKIYTGTYTWQEAKEKCEKAGGYLATVTSQEEQDFLDQLNKNYEELWIGGYRGDDYVWKWVTGEKWDYTNWGEGEPNDSYNVIGNENRVAFWPDGWNDLNEQNIYEQHGFICEWDYGAPIEEEKNGHYYEIFYGTYTWEEAKKLCESKGGYLATITSQEEQEVIDHLNAKGDDLWIGGYRGADFVWKWVTGEEWNYTHWNEGEPNDSNAVIDNENKVVVQWGGWNDLNEENIYEQVGYICEWDTIK